MCSEKKTPPRDDLIWKWQAISDQSSLEPRLIRASPQCLGYHKTFKRHLDQMGILFDPGPKSFFSTAGSTDRFIEGWERESGLPPPPLFFSFFFTFSFFHSYTRASLSPFIPVLWPTGLSLVAARLSSHLEYMNKRLEELRVLEDTDLPLLELNASC